ncbi:hypothetical protein GCM10011512_23310 [Tersicoccus solisilvae]|uniref:DUF4157 domain-containing protein n=1 Tax=Tersicoccus solisilvae TaxID=1882339 RepID=A0ABQ1PEF4_9MICC|nr:hypothetical protein [Tersicoccus solisilvae]GGC95618.1 hypothetical protein GCM10011512_23310 [Tersicoccus solisilvae]
MTRGRTTDLTRRQRLRRAANWVNLSTPLGLGVAALTGTPVRRGPHGLYVGTGYRPPLPVAGAFTVGNVVLVRGRAPGDLPLTAALSPDLLRHEAAHATQYAALLGLPFLPAYALAAAWSLLRTGDPASRNVFERRAGLRLGGYRERPVRTLRASRRRG